MEFQICVIPNDTSFQYLHFFRVVIVDCLNRRVEFVMVPCHRLNSVLNLKEDKSIYKKYSMKDHLKVSVRFFDDREVRAVWDDEHAKWWFKYIGHCGCAEWGVRLHKSSKLLEIPKGKTEERK